MCMECEGASCPNRGTAQGLNKGRKKIWQLERPFHCSIIGTCLSLRELTSLSRKLRLHPQRPLSDYGLHSSFVVMAGRHDHGAQRIHKYLDEKYRAQIRRASSLRSDAELTALWQEALESGELAGIYWALVTHPHTSEPLLDRIYGEVHMLSHLSGATVRVDMQELSRLKRQNASLSRQLNEAKSRSREQLEERETSIRQLNRQLAQLQSSAQELARLRQQDGVGDAGQWEQRLAAECQRAERAEANAGKWKQLAMDHGDLQLRLEGELAELRAERNSLEQALAELLAPECGACSSQEACAELNLCGRCVLYVGGRDRLCGHFRQLVERQNGRFLHHDGGLHDGRLRLGAILPQADVVLCPLDCVSHDAANRIKRFCKQQGKRLVFLPRASLAAFTRGLNEAVA
jgi:hypothetical protein